MEINTEFEIPDGLSDLGRRAAEIILSTATFHDPDLSGWGCKAFYSPQEWAAHGEQYGTGAELVVVHDGGSLARFFNFDYGEYELVELMSHALSCAGTFAEPCCTWYTAIYKT